jgi:phage major head subunit gpT-like protein
MDQSILSSRAIMGMYFARLEASAGAAWVNAVSNLFTSDQASETYAFLGQSPAMREWIGGRQAKGLSSNSIILPNRHFEATLEIAVRDARRDKTPQIRARVEELADRTVSHWGSLLSQLLLAGETTACYDGQFFFDTDHQEGDSPVQSNDIQFDISDAPTIAASGAKGTPTNPGVEILQGGILRGITQIMGLVDDRGEPMNEEATDFLVMVPTSMHLAAMAAMNPQATMAMQQNLNANLNPGMRISVVSNPRLSWTDRFAVFRADSPIKALIRQSEQDVELKAKAEGSEFEFDNDAWQFGVDSWRNVTYGYWQRACLVTLVA